MKSLHVLLIFYFHLLPYVHMFLYDPKFLFEKIPGYGTTWMFFPDGCGIPQIIPLILTNIIPKIYTPTQEYVTFHLYTRQNQDNSQILNIESNFSITESNIDLSKPIKFVIHGWQSDYNTNTCQRIKNNFLKTEDINVIVVDWKTIAANIIYPISVIETRNVGNVVGEMIDVLVAHGADLKNIHLIGHSLGAHVSGRAGYAVKGGKVATITALDPALPGFDRIAVDENKLDKTDAEFVQIIHTCGGILGYYSKIGHVDFFPNGGMPSQPGCFGLPEVIESCSHGRSWEYFADSILNNNIFMGTSCESWEKFKNGDCSNNEEVPMGIATPNTARGPYFLRTQNDTLGLGFIDNVVDKTQSNVANFMSVFG